MRRVIVGFFLICLMVTPALSEELTFATLNWEPYSSELLVGNGFTAEVVTEAAKRMNCTATFTYLPWRRAKEDTRLGKYDALLNAYNSKERSEIYGVSIPYAASELTLLVLADSDIKWTGNLRALQQYSFGVVAGYAHTAEFDNAKYLRKFEAPTDVNNISMLLAGHVDIIAIDRFVAVYLLKNHPAVEGGIGDVRFLSKPLAINPLHVLFSKARPGWEKRLAAFNAGLQEVMDDGTLEIILHKYGFLTSMHKDN